MASRLLGFYKHPSFLIYLLRSSMKMPLFETTKKSHGPAIGVHFELVENRIHHIYMTLGNGEGLEWYLYGDSARNKQVQKQIHAWMKNYLDRLPGTLPALYFSPKI
ncbi:Methylated-DNA--protein-cysteine methyltransferase, partial [Parachlamydia acanthamoebae]